MNISKKYSTPAEWFRNNKNELKKYRSKWIAYNENGVIAYDKNYIRLVHKADKIKDKYVIAHIHEIDFMESVRFLPIRFRSVIFRKR
jgi:hypothetical protein